MKFENFISYFDSKRKTMCTLKVCFNLRTVIPNSFSVLKRR